MCPIGSEGQKKIPNPFWYLNGMGNHAAGAAQAHAFAFARNRNRKCAMPMLTMQASANARRPKRGSKASSSTLLCDQVMWRMQLKEIGYLLNRPVGRPPHEVRRYYASFGYQAQS